MNSPSEDSRPAPSARYRRLSALEGPLVKLAGVSCRDFASLKAESLYRPLVLNERLRLRFHARMCELCKNFGRQLELMDLLTHELEEATVVVDETDSAFNEQSQRLKDEVRRKIGTGEGR